MKKITFTLLLALFGLTSSFAQLDSCWVGFTSDIQQAPNSGNWVGTFTAWSQGQFAPYTYQWDFGNNVLENGETVTYAYSQAGTYTVCVYATDANGDVCSVYCEDITVGAGGLPCSAYFQEGTQQGVTYFYGSAEGGDGNYSYLWDFGDGSTSTQLSPAHQYVADGVYAVCFIVTTGDGQQCEDCHNVTIGTTNPTDTTCYFSYTAADTLGGVSFTAYADSPSSFYWDFGNNQLDTQENPFVYFEDGTYYVCLTTTDANGAACTYCEWLTVNTGWNPPTDECLDWTILDFSTNCPQVYDPVCGCDGITYENSCIAEFCFGVTEWTTGPCSTNPNDPNTGNNGGNNNPLDSVSGCGAEFFYYGLATSDSTYEYVFIPLVEQAGSWDFGDGTTSEELFPSHTYAVEDSLAAYTVCFSGSGIFPCTVCETIILDASPNGNIGGGIFTTGGDSLTTNSGTVERGSTTDPLVGATVLLQNVNGTIIDQTVTGNNGEYNFTGLQFGYYFIKVSVEGIEHEPYGVRLNPVVQGLPTLDFTVNAATSSVNTVTFAKNIQVFPNPVQNTVNIRLNMTEQADLNLSLINIFGQTMSTKASTVTQGEKAITLDVTDLASGIYFVRVQAGDEVFTQKIVKQ